MSFHCRRTRTIPAVNSGAPELNSPVFAPNLLMLNPNKHHKHVTLCQFPNINYTLTTMSFIQIVITFKAVKNIFFSNLLSFSFYIFQPH